MEQIKNKTVYFLIDCSGSMYGSRADAVNNAMAQVVSQVFDDIRGTKDATLNLSFVVLGFTDAHKDKVFEIVPKTALEDFKTWDPIDPEAFNGGTPTGAALKKVIDDLQGGAYHGDVDVNAVAPAIILISDGEPNGKDPTYEEMLECAEKGNPHEVTAFRKALRVALGISVNDAGRESLKKFGKVSARMERSGIAAYYDCSEQYASEFAEILKSVTINASMV
ncbi:MAG: VWA domain-containing protein [Clostridia bacterium]|nr:VWA domain-containing protein [Clostridia bacterium]